MVSLKVIYYDIARIVNGICDKTYYQDRPTSIDKRINSYLVVTLPSYIRNNEIDPKGSYNDYSTSVLLEVYVRDKMSASNPNGVDLKTMDEKVGKIMRLFPINTDSLLVTKPEVFLNDNDGSGFHVTYIRASLRTK